MYNFLLFIMVLLFTGQSFFLKCYSQNQSSDVGQSNATFSIVYGAFAGIATLLLGAGKYAPTLPTLLLGGMNALMLLLFNTASLQGNQRGSYAFLMITSLSGGILVPLVCNCLFQGEVLNVWQLLAIVLMLASFVVMNLKGMTFSGVAKTYYFWCALVFLTNGLYGVLMDYQGRLTGGTQTNEMIITTFLGMSLATFCIQCIRQPRTLRTMFCMRRKALAFLLLTCTCATCAVNLLLRLLLITPSATVLYAVNNGSVLVCSALLAYTLLHEKPTASRVIGIGLSCASILMLSLL
ncbi:MAG: EamA family transporter [Clostridia bacterium]